MIGAVEWGSLPDGVVAVGTLLTLIATYKLLRQETVRRQEDEATWAAMVSCGTEQTAGGLIAVVNNSGPAPIYRCHLTIRRHDNGGDGDHFNVVDPGKRATHLIPSSFYADEVHPLRTEVTFFDARGRSWRRGFSGELESVEWKP